jgi:hypothetical protein
MPNTQFDATLYYRKGVLEVCGPLAPEEDDDPRELVVVAFVTQHQPATASKRPRNVTVAGEARLFPTDKKGTWQVVRPESSFTPAPTTAPSQGLTYKYSLERSKKWRFTTKRSGLKAGPAFGTAVLIVFKDDGTIETYSWSGWIDIAKGQR